MFFILSKTIGYLIRPLVLIGISILGHFVLKNPMWKKRFLILSGIAFFFFTNKFIANEAVRLYEAPLVPLATLEERGKAFEAGIVLTGVTKGKKILNDRVYIDDNADRVNHTIMLYKKGIIKKIIISGGTGKLINPDFSEAMELKKVFAYSGIPAEHMIIEGKSRNTHESAVEVKKLLPEADGKNFLLITSATHIPRSIRCFRKVGLNCQVFPTDQNFDKREFTPEKILLPNSEAIKIWDDLFKEITGIAAYWMAGYI